MLVFFVKNNQLFSHLIYILFQVDNLIFSDILVLFYTDEKIKKEIVTHLL